MVIGNRSNRYFVAGILAVFLLAGCAQEVTAPDAASSVPIQSKVEREKPASANGRAAVVEERKAEYAGPNPVLIAFEKLSVKLSDTDKQILAQFGARARKEKVLTITGYCDRHQVGNAKAAAISRATAVRDELIRVGVDPKTIRIKYVTEAANKHAAEIQF